eukprot:scaffold27008_cov67-Phaeocystis_antarctica.AAC.4
MHGVSGGWRRLIGMGGPQKLNAQVVPIYWEGGRFATRSNGLVRLGRRSAQSEAVRAALAAGATRRPVAHGRAPATSTVRQLRAHNCLDGCKTTGPAVALRRDFD